MKNIVYFIVVLVVTAAILTGLFFYNKGQTKELSAQLKISDDVALDIYKGTSRPLEAAKYHVILYVKAKNNSSKAVDLRQKPPTDPCVSLRNTQSRNYNQSDPYTSPTPTPTPNAQNNYQMCTQDDAYKAYLQKTQEYQNQMQNPNILELWTPQDQKCEIDPSYTINKRYPNIGSSIVNNYEPNQSRIGTLIYDCPENTGNFTLKYNDESATLPL